jgi:hypothetical protein
MRSTVSARRVCAWLTASSYVVGSTVCCRKTFPSADDNLPASARNAMPRFYLRQAERERQIQESRRIIPAEAMDLP